MKTLRNQNGMILVTVLLLMMVVAILGTIAINTSTIDIQIFGNLKKSSETLESGEAGVEISIPIIERSLSAAELEPTQITVNGSTRCLDKVGGDCSSSTANNLGLELTGGSNYDADSTTSNPDLKMPMAGGVEVTVDIDRLYSYTLPGGALEFASGYEGVGAAAAGGGVGVLYRITSEGCK